MFNLFGFWMIVTLLTIPLPFAILCTMLWYIVDETLKRYDLGNHHLPKMLVVIHNKCEKWNGDTSLFGIALCIGSVLQLVMFFFLSLCTKHGGFSSEIIFHISTIAESASGFGAILFSLAIPVIICELSIKVLGILGLINRKTGISL